MSLQSAFQECLDDGDVLRCKALWGKVYPHLPQPQDISEAEVVLHCARTAAESLRLEKRLYSHAWLDERGLRSALPDDLRPKTQRIHPVIFPAVGVSVKAMSSRADRREEAKLIEKVMGDAAGELVQMGVTDRDRIVERMWKAREDFINGRLKRMI